MTRVSDNVYVLQGAVNTGVIRDDGYALLIDCCDSMNHTVLSEIGVEKVELILCTQHRRPNVAGAEKFISEGAELVVPEKERRLFEDVESYWADPANRWHLYHHQPGPQVLARSLPVSRGVGVGDVIEWRGITIRVLDTPGSTAGSVSYLLTVGDKVIGFSGDVICGDGKVPDLFSLQKSCGDQTDYHSFLGNGPILLASAKTLADSGIDTLIPSQGEPIDDVASAVDRLNGRMDKLLRNYVAISSINHYFPDMYAAIEDDPQRMKPVPLKIRPEFVDDAGYTSRLIISESGAGLLIDGGNAIVIDGVNKALESGQINSLEACWITHYHDDHVNALPEIVEAFGCDIITDRHVAEVLEHPSRFYLPCISHLGTPVDRITEDGESWQWHEFTLTAYHLPGQTLYHSGLLVEGRGAKLFFGGDSGSPCGVDDHCCPNRNFLGGGRGFRRCFEIWRECEPDCIFNEHQPWHGYVFDSNALDYMDRNLASREELVADLVPWDDPNFGLDESWVRAYPYEQNVRGGEEFTIGIEFTNHSSSARTAYVEPVLPGGWECAGATGAEIVVEARTSGFADEREERPDGVAEVSIRLPDGVEEGRYTVPFRVTWGGRYLGQFRHAIVVASQPF